MNPTLRRYFVEYADGHRHPTNRLTHKVAIPLIVFHILAMLDWVKLTQVGGHDVTLAHVAYLLTILFYVSLTPRLAVVMALVIALCFPLAWITPRPVVVACAVVGWLVQLAGHVVWEKKSPSFFTNLLHALIGPLFFVAVLIGAWPVKDEAAPAVP